MEFLNLSRRNMHQKRVQNYLVLAAGFILFSVGLWTTSFPPTSSSLRTEIRYENSKEEEFMRILRHEDKRLIDNLIKLDVANLTDDEAMDKTFRIVAEPLQGVCRHLKSFGGKWMPYKLHHAIDGNKFICLDRISMKKDCLIYSFGSNNEWEFEDVADKMGCITYVYDHTIVAPPRRGSNIHFIKTGMGTEKTPELDTLENHIATNNHQGRLIDYLKVDIEEEELNSLPQWIETGVLNNVDQLALEMHLNVLHKNVYKKEDWVSEKHRFKDILTQMQELYKQNFRIVSFIPNLSYGKALNDEYYSLYEIVYMKDNVWNYLDD